MDIKYMIIKENSTEKLTEEVQLKIKEGWKLLGGVAVGFSSTFTFFAQALIKVSE